GFVHLISKSDSECSSFVKFLYFQQPKPVHQPECNNVASVDTGMSNPAARADSSHCIPGRKAMSSISLSFSGLTGESSAGDFKIVGYCQ
ncbi:Os08g0233300, partial [Oryza sativa Japonica Group]